MYEQRSGLTFCLRALACPLCRRRRSPVATRYRARNYRYFGNFKWLKAQREPIAFKGGKLTRVGSRGIVAYDVIFYLRM